MAITFKYEFTPESIQQRDGDIRIVRANLVGTDDTDGRFSSVTIRAKLGPADPGTFVPYEEVTQEMCETWLDRSLTAQSAPAGWEAEGMKAYYMDHIEKNIARSRIPRQKPIERGERLPWMPVDENE